MTTENELQIRQIGPYRLESRLGAGGMGEVYRAFDERLRRPVALKQLLPDAAEDPRARARFRREARSAARLDHPGIVRIYDVVEVEGREWIVMELVKGRSLKRLSADEAPLPVERVAALGADVAEALAAAHSEGIVHRDLKASNVLVTPADRVKILDFGLAKPVTLASKSDPISEAGQLLGTPHAMSPEQARGHAVDLRSDLFSFGTLLYEMLTGTSPFLADAMVETLTRVCVYQPPPLHEAVAGIPRPMTELVAHLHEKNPDHRPRGAGELVLVLRQLTAAPAPSAESESEDESDDGGTTIRDEDTLVGRPARRVSPPPRNPFFHRQGIADPRHFIGRADMVRSLFDMITSAQSCAVVGERRIGKSSLLAQLSHREVQEAHGLEARRLLSPVLDFLALHSASPEELWHEILETLELVAPDRETEEVLATALAQDEITFAVLRRALRRLRRRELRVVLLCDEFELAVQNPKFDPAFFGALRSLAGNEGVVFVTATRSNLLELEQYKSDELRRKVLGSPFFNIFAEFRLGPFESEEVTALLETSLEPTPVRFDRADVGWLHRVAGRHPYFLQLAAYHLYDAYERQRRGSGLGGDTPEEARDEAAVELRREAAKIFRNQWQHSGEEERRALGALAVASTRKAEPRAGFDGRLLARLERRALIHRAHPGRAGGALRHAGAGGALHHAGGGDLRAYRIFSEIFAEWILSEVTVSLSDAAGTVELRPAPAAAPPAPAPPERYSILEEIGRGGSGTVFKAWDERLERVVAIKVLDERLRSSPDHLERLLREARACAGLRHPHIVVIHDVDAENGQLVQEFLPGGSLRDLLEKVPVLATGDLLQLAEQLAAALGTAHAAGVVHRDLKPENVLLTQRPPVHGAGRAPLLPDVKLSDFGTALRLDELDSADERRSLAGTLAYMAPEQFLGQRVGPAADFFALGMMLYEARHGERPAPAQAEARARLVARSSGPERAFDALVARCLAREPGDRFRDADVLLAEIREVRDAAG